MNNGLAIVQPDQKTTEELDRFSSWATGLAVSNVVERENAINILRGWKTLRAGIVLFFNGTPADPGMKPKAYSAWKSICDKEGFFLKRGDSAEESAKEAIKAFDRVEKAKAEAEQRRLQAIVDEQARKEREKLEQQAARQRQIEEEARAKAEAARKAAEEANAADRARLLKEAEAADRKAAAAAVKVEAKEEQAAEIVAPVVQVASAVPKVKGSSTSVTWKARLIKDVGMELLVEEAAEEVTGVAMSFLTFNEKAADDFARNTKGMIKVPGIEFYPDDNLSISTK